MAATEYPIKKTIQGVDFFCRFNRMKTPDKEASLVFLYGIGITKTGSCIMDILLKILISEYTRNSDICEGATIFITLTNFSREFVTTQAINSFVPCFYTIDKCIFVEKY